jgi:tetratricopeptide (TPR) repeat protein
MANPNLSKLPPPSPEHRRIAVGQFERANQVVATGNYDYGIRLLLSCCKLDPANLIYRQALRRTEKAKYGNNLRGSFFGGLFSWTKRARLKNALRGRDYLKALEHGETILRSNPWDVPAQMDLAEAAENLGLLDLAVWYLEQARQKKPQDVHVNRTLARLYEKRGNFTQAMALWALVKKAKPTDEEAQHKLKDLAADDTIARGQYEAVVENKPGDAAKPAGQPGSKEMKAASPVIRRPPTDPQMPAADRVTREAAPLRARLEADPTSAPTYLQLATVYRRAGDNDRARAVLQEGLGPTGNAFELGVELADLEAEPFRRDLAATEEKLKADPDNAELCQLRNRLRKEVNSREMDVFRKKAERYPTEMVHRYELGVRLLRLGQVDEAIKELQMSRGDPRHRWQSLMHLGHCFKARNNWRLAQRNFEESLQGLPPGDVENRKALLYELAQGCAAAGDLPHAIDLAQELANLDFNYRDIGRLLDEWEAAASR